MLSGKKVPTPHANARCRSMDASAGERLPGVKAVHLVERNREGARLKNPPPSPERYPTVRYAGQTVAAVAATSLAIAEEAARLVKVDYELLPFVVGLDEARAAGAALGYPGAAAQHGSG